LLIEPAVETLNRRRPSLDGGVGDTGLALGGEEGAALAATCAVERHPHLPEEAEEDADVAPVVADGVARSAPHPLKEFEVTLEGFEAGRVLVAAIGIVTRRVDGG
jgi:hypothetical protein